MNIKILALLCLITPLNGYGAASPSVPNDSECLRNGWESGTLSGNQFCNVLEAKFRTRRIEHRAANYELFCEKAMSLACKAAIDNVVTTRNLCGRLITENWNGASSDLFSFKETACPYRAPKYTCPIGTKAFQQQWCQSATGAYLAHYDGSWWRFIDNMRGINGEALYLLQAENGRTVAVAYGDIDLVEDALD